MIEIFITFLLSCIFMYNGFFIIDYINKKDNVSIKNNIIIKFVISLLFSFVICILYIKIQSMLMIIPLFITLFFITILGYIDYHTKYVYSIVSMPFMIVSFIVFIINILNHKISSQDILIILILSGIFWIFGKLKYIGTGDVDVIVALLAILSGNLFIEIFIIFLGFGISGIVSIFLLIFKKVGLNHRKPFIPALAVATYLLLFLY